ncbi:hypothetical protein [Pantoea sp. OXWO6B1]|uniref:hypothetical protein n=1 Tax=Pantoea sp. OXWO6B1 TaxID=1835724 RepID=UPI000AF69292|nr:hypothetical protein [Pantoea sp. OXWO6B1]
MTKRGPFPAQRLTPFGILLVEPALLLGAGVGRFWGTRAEMYWTMMCEAALSHVTRF